MILAVNLDSLLGRTYDEVCILCLFACVYLRRKGSFYLIYALSCNVFIRSLVDLLQATELLKKAEGMVTLTVCNPNESKTGQDQKEKQKGKENLAVTSVTQKTPQKVVAGEY